MKHKNRKLLRWSSWASALVLLLLLLPVVLAQQFVVPREYPIVGFDAAYHATTGDFNGDGKLDVATVNLSLNTVSVLLGNGDGTFQPPVDYPVGWSPYVVVVGDFNGDGKLDLAVSSFSANANLCPNQCQSIVSILLGNGDGTFQPHMDFSTGGLTPVGMAAGDFNGDGKLDLVIANGQVPSNAVSVLLGNGDGTFQSAANYSTDLSPLSVAVGDFNDDGKSDIAVLNHDLGGTNGVVVSILIGNGDGTFKPRVDYATSNGATGFVPNEIVIGDFRGNGIKDLAVSSAYGVDVLLGNGDGTFQPNVNYSTFGALCGVAFTCEGGLAVGDFNGDGRDDLAAAVFGLITVDVLFSNSDGTFQAPAFYTATSFIGNLGPYTLAAGDFNGDKIPDILAPAGAFAVLLNNGRGLFDAPLNYSTGSNPEAVASADFNGDGKLDLATANAADSTVSVLLGNGDGTFKVHVDYPTGPGPFSIAAADFNGDGKLDLATANYGANSVSVLLGNGDGTLKVHVDYPTGLGPFSIAAADFNGDGKLDLATANYGANSVSVLLGNGDGTFQAHVDYTTGLGPSSVVAGDFNGDGKVDLAVAFGGDPKNQATNKGEVDILINQGNGTFLPAVAYTTGGVPSAVAVGDFNHDGHLDLAVVNGGESCFTNKSGLHCSYGTTLGILLGNGDGTFAAAVTYGPLAFPENVLVSDFNGDGNPDVTVANGVCNNVACGGTSVGLFLGNGDGTFHSRLDYEVGYVPRGLAAGDFDGDLKPDLAVTESSFNLVTLLRDNFTGPANVLTTGSGTLLSQPPGIACGTDCNASYGSGTSVTVLPEVIPGNIFTGWSGDCTGTSTCVLDMNVDHTVVPNIITNPTTYTVTTVTSGSGTGLVGPVYNPGVCATGCPVNAGSLFILGETPNTGSVFAGWSGGGCTASMLDCNLIVNSDVTVTATFLTADALTLSLAGSGGGTVVSNPGGINCGSACSGTFGSGTAVVLTATPNSTSTFTGWSGPCSGAGTCNVTMNGAEAVTATFAAENFSLTPASATLNLQPGTSGTDTITLAGANGTYGGTIQLSCTVSGPAPTPSCGLSPNSVTPGNNSTTSKLTVTASAAGLQSRLAPRQLHKFAYALWLPLIFGITFAASSNKQRHGRLVWCSALLLLLALQVACGGGSNGGGTPPPTNYTVTVTGNSGALTHSTQIAVTVQ